MDALALHRIGLALADGRDPEDVPEEEEPQEVTAHQLRYIQSRSLTLADLKLALADLFRDPRKTPSASDDYTEHVVAEARRRRGLE